MGKPEIIGDIMKNLLGDLDAPNVAEKAIEVLSGELPPSNPVEAINEEIEKAKNAPDKVGLLSIKSANAWIEDAMKRPDPVVYFHGLIVQYENTVVFASSNVGKSIFVTQIAEEIAYKEKLLYLDLELADKQFQMRYTDPTTGDRHIFPTNFMRAEIDPESIVGTDLEESILNSIEEAAKQGIRFFVVDNITFICNDSEKGATAGSFMMKLIRLKKQYHLTTIIIAHTPKRRGWEPITQNDLAGSAKLINFFDAGIAIARSAKDNNLRYVKQVKVRTGEYKYDADNVMIYDVSKVCGFLKFEFQGYGKESEHLKNGDDGGEYDEIMDVVRLQKDGKSIRETAKILGISRGKVERRLRTAKENNITLQEIPEKTVTTVTTVTEARHPRHSRQEIEQRLPYKDDE